MSVREDECLEAGKPPVFVFEISLFGASWSLFQYRVVEPYLSAVFSQHPGLARSPTSYVLRPHSVLR